MLRQIVEKEIPLRHAPKSGHLVIVEANHESGNNIELLSEAGQGTESMDPLNNAAHVEQSRDFAKHRQPIHVEPKTGMTKQLRDVEKITRAASKIENPLWTRQIKFNGPDSANVNLNPSLQIEILWPVRSGISHCITAANLLEFNWIDCFDYALRFQREGVRAQQPQRMFSRASQAAAVYQFLYFVTQSHKSHIVAERNNFN